MARRRFANIAVAYPGLLGIKTDKGQQFNYPHPLDAPTVDYDTMVLRYDTGGLSTDAPYPTPDPDPVPVTEFVTYQSVIVTYYGEPVTYTYEP